MCIAVLLALVPPLMGGSWQRWFYEALVPGLNCGDGFMYVTASADAKSAAAWWQC